MPEDKMLTTAGNNGEQSEIVRKIATELKRLVLDAEHDFLQTGNELIRINSNLDKLNAMVRKVSAIIGHSGQEGILGEFDELSGAVVRTMDNLLAIMLEVREEVQRKNMQIYDFRIETEALKSMGRDLGIIALNIKVQSGRLSSGRDSFYAFGREIKELSGRIGRIGNSILEDCTRIKEAQSREMHRIGSELDKISNYMNESSSNSGYLHNKILSEQNEILPGFSRTGEIADLISRKVSSVVTALQIHDLIRQKIEHLGADLEKILSGDAALTVESVVLQSNQIELVLSELKLARESSESAFMGIHGEVENLLDSIKVNESGQGILFNLLNNALSGLSGLLRHFDEASMLGKNIREVLEEALAGVKALEGYAETTAEINETLEMKSINAIVMTGGLKGQSRPFRVLGEQVSVISEKSIGLVSRIREKIRAIISERKEFPFEKLRREHDRYKEEIDRLRDFYDSLRSDFSSTIAETAGIRNALVRSAEGMVFISELIGRIEDLKREWDSLEEGAVSGGDTVDREALHRYTMESERRIYREVYGMDKEKGGDDDSSVTLF